MDRDKYRCDRPVRHESSSPDKLYAHWFPGHELKDVPQLTFFSPLTFVYFYMQRAFMEDSFDDAHNHYDGFLWRFNTRFAERYIFSKMLETVVTQFSYDKGNELLRLCRAVEALDVGERFGGVLLHSIISYPEFVGQKLYSAGIMKKDKPLAVAFFTAGSRGKLVKKKKTDEKVVSVMLPNPAI